jgi:hypothetical protein
LGSIEERSGQVAATRQLSRRHQELQAVVARHVEGWDREFDAFLRAAQTEAEALRERHERELAEFDAAASANRLVSKRSPRLLALREREARLVRTKRFADADRMRREADLQEEGETEVAAAKSRREYIQRRKRLIQEQDREMEALLTHSEATRQSFLTARDRKVAGYLRRMNWIDRELEYRLEDGGVDESEVCDPEPDPQRIGFAWKCERSPFPSFPRVGQTRTPRGKSAPKARRRGLSPGPNPASV